MSSRGGTIFGGRRYDTGILLSDDAKIVRAGDGSASCARQTLRGVHLPAPQAARLAPGTIDRVLATVVLAGGLLELLISAGTDGLAGVPVLLLVAAGLLLRRARPLGALLPGVAALVLVGLLPKEVADGIGGPFLAVIFLVFSMATRVDPPRLYLATLVTLAGTVTSIAIDDYPDDASAFLVGAVLVVVAPVAGGRLLRARMELTRALREKAERTERGRARRAQAAVDAERTRIAGELHDVVAHALGAMTVQAAAARRLSEKDPARAADAFQAVEETGREALTELRRLLGVLRHEDADLALAPQPRLAFLQELARRATAAGLQVQVDVQGTAVDLPAGVDQTAYRVVQDALTEAHRQGGAGHATVHVRHRQGEIEVEVLDDGDGSGRRLLGMRERVRVYGGQLEIAPRRGGGHRVRARLPVEAAS